MNAGGLAQAVAAVESGDADGAAAVCDALLRADPGDAGALAVLGLVAQQRGDLRRARDLLAQAAGIRPGDAQLQYNLAVVCGSLDDISAAIAAYEAAIARAPAFAAALSNIGILYARCGRFADALRAYAAAIEAQPDFAAAYGNLAALLVERERYAEAIAVLEAALRVAPDLAELHINLGFALRQAGRVREGLIATQRGLTLKPNVGASLRLSLAAFEAGAFDIALAANLRALAVDPGCAAAHCNCATLYLTMGRYPEAIAAGRAAIALAPDYAEAHVNLALALLVCGDFAAGWHEYTWTWRLPARRPSYPYIDVKPLWRGEDFAGRRLLVTREQGFGDAIQMVRFLPAVKARGGRVVLETAPELAALFAQLPGVDELRPAPIVGIVGDDVDLHLPLLGLPGALGIDEATIPAPIPYLRAPAERMARWQARLGDARGLRVGLVWAGSAAHVDDRQRSVRLEDLAPLGAIGGVSWFGLQRDRDADRRECGSLRLEPLGGEIGDFADAAAVVELLDLVIAVDTAIVHLAGALGKPVWTLLPFAPDWRWMRDRDDTPWYPTMRLFRQPRPGDWAAVVAAAGAALCQAAAQAASANASASNS